MTDPVAPTFEQMRARNLPAMLAAVARWIDDAQTHPDGPRLLHAKADWVESQLGELDRAAGLDLDTPSHLDGLTAPDLIVARGRLQDAANRLQQRAA